MTDQEFVQLKFPSAICITSTIHRGKWRIRNGSMIPYSGPIYLSKFCKTQERAWKAARSKIIHRILSKMDE